MVSTLIYKQMLVASNVFDPSSTAVYKTINPGLVSKPMQKISCRHLANAIGDEWDRINDIEIRLNRRRKSDQADKARYRIIQLIIQPIIQLILSSSSFQQRGGVMSLDRSTEQDIKETKGTGSQEDQGFRS